jgi:hypothetical protein
VSEQRAVHLRVRITDQDDRVRLDRTARLRGDSPDLELPTTVPVSPLDGDASRAFRIEGQLLDAQDQVFSEQRAVISFIRDRRFEVRLRFSDVCIDQLDCTQDETCRDGVCADARITEPGQDQELGLPSDAQLGACTDDLCWEHPRPTSSSFGGACIDAAGVGYAGTSIGLMFRHDGAEDDVWVQETAPEGDIVRDMACWSGGTVVAVGRGIWWRTEAGWSVEERYDFRTQLEAVHGQSPEDVWAVGNNGLVLRRQGEGLWQPVDSGTTADLYGVWVAPSGNVYVTGDGGLHHRFDGDAWTSIAVPPELTGAVTALTGTADDDQLALHEGVIYSFNGDAWSFEFSGSLPIRSLDVNEDGSLAAGGRGRGGLHVRTVPEGWQYIQGWGHTGESVSATSVTGDRVLWAGAAGVIGRFIDGEFIDDRVAFKPSTLRALEIVPDDPVGAIAVGDAGAIFERVAEGRWRRRVLSGSESVVETDFTGLHVGDGPYVLVGEGGVIGESEDGRVWSVVESGTEAHLRDVDGEGRRIIAVGDSGTLLTRDRDGEWAPAAATVPADANLTSVFVSREGTRYVGADDGRIWTGDGSSVSLLATVEGPVNRILGTEEGQVWAAARDLYRLGAVASGAERIALPGDLAGELVLDMTLGPEGPEWVVVARFGSRPWERTGDGEWTERSAAGRPLRGVTALPDEGGVLVFGSKGTVARYGSLRP